MALHQELTAEIREGPSGPHIGAFFDVDRTLWAGFSAFAFMRARLFSGRMAPRDLVESLAGMIGFASGRQGFSALMSATTATYAGLSESVLEEIGREIFESQLASDIYPESRALVRAHQEMGHTVAIVSSATRYQVDPLAEDLGVENVLCTRLELKDGAFTGRVISPTCWGEGKAEAGRQLAQQHDLDLDESYFYTDSTDDLPLVDLVGRPRPINPDSKLSRRAEREGWPIRRFQSRGRPALLDLVRTGLTYGSIAPAVGAALSVGVLNRSRRDGLNVLSSVWSELALPLAGVDVQVEGEEHLWSQRPAVFIFNHQSAIDLPIMLKLVRRDFTGVGKEEVRWNPLFGPLFWLAGVAFIDRTNTAKAIEALAPAVEALRTGTSLLIAPEGTRSTTPRLARFKKGAFHIAMQAEVPIVPVVFRNALDALPKHSIVVRPATVEVVVLPPVDTSSWERATLDEHIHAIRRSYLDVLGQSEEEEP